MGTGSYSSKIKTKTGSFYHFWLVSVVFICSDIATNMYYLRI